MARRGERGSGWRLVVACLRSPWATLVFGVLLAWAVRAGSLDSFTTVRAGSPTNATGGPEFGVAHVVRTRQGLQVVDPNLPEAPGSRTVGMVWYAYRRSASAETAMAVGRESQGIAITGSISNSELAQVESLYIAYLNASPDRYWRRVGADLAAGGGGTRASSGLRVVFFLQLLLVPLVVLSLGWVPSAMARLRARARRIFSPPLTPQEKRWRSLSRGECPACRYSIAGLSGTQCPECGEKWHALEMTAWERLR